MASFTILTGKALTAAIKGFGKVAASFTERTHQLAYSALNHAEEHHCASHLNNLFAVTPLNYRNALRVWASDLGKVTFVAEPAEAGQHFVYAKGSTSDLPTALATSPADYVKAKGAGKAAAEFNELKALEAFLAKLDEKGASAATLRAIEGAIRLLKVEPAAVEVKPTRKAKGPKLVVENAGPVAFIGPVVPAGWDRVEGGGEIAPAAAAA